MYLIHTGYFNEKMDADCCQKYSAARHDMDKM
jgi:hypothetical protein